MSNSSEQTLRVKLNDPHMNEGALLFLPGLGGFENGRVREVTSREIEQYEQRTRREFRQVIDAHPFLSFTDEAPQPTPEPVDAESAPLLTTEQEQPATEEETTEEETPSPRRRRRGDEE